MAQIVVTDETMPKPKLDTILFEGIVSLPSQSPRREGLSPLLDQSGQLYMYQLEDGTLVRPYQVAPIPTKSKAA